MVEKSTLAVLSALLITLAGCSGIGAPNATTPQQTTSSTTTTTEASTTTTQTSQRPDTTTRDTPEKGTQYVDVKQLDNQSRIQEVSDAKKTGFENLSNPRRTVFLDALRNGTVTFNRSESNPFSFYNQSRPEYVRYNDTWYFVRTSIV